MFAASKFSQSSVLLIYTIDPSNFLKSIIVNICLQQFCFNTRYSWQQASKYRFTDQELVGLILRLAWQSQFSLTSSFVSINLRLTQNLSKKNPPSWHFLSPNTLVTNLILFNSSKGII